MMHRLTTTLFVLLFFLAVDTPAIFAQSSGDTVYRFLNLTSSSRAAAMGGSHVALPNADASMFLINPAYISKNTHRNFSLNYLNHIGDINMGFAGGAWHLDDIGTIGAGIRFINYGDMNEIDDLGNTLGSLSANDLAFTVGLSREVAPNLYFGGATSLIYSSIGTYASTALGFNFGLLYYAEAIETHFGATIQNTGFQLSQFDNTREDLPLDIRIGASRSLQYLPIRLSIMLHSLDKWDMPTLSDESAPSFTDNLFRHLIFGAELSFSENVHARVGYDHFLHEELKVRNRLDGAGFSFGLGIRYKGFVFDISRNSYSELGGLTRFGIQTFL